jgi:putative transposase
MVLFNQKYRIESTRLRGWDYSDPGYYFVTICTKDRICYFDKVVHSQVVLSDIGMIVFEEWKETEKKRHNIKLDSWIIMPNHIHGIIIITEKCDHPVETSRRDVSTTIKLKPDSLGSIIGQFKSVCAKKIRQMGNDNFEWQSRFYDHIIRNDQSINNIRRYIQYNPKQWDMDRNNPDGLTI